MKKYGVKNENYRKQYKYMIDKENLLTLSFKDFFTSKMMKYSILPFVITMAIVYILFFVVAGIGLDSLGTLNVNSTQTTLENGIPHTQTIESQLEGFAIINYLMSYSLISWIASTFIYVVGGAVTLYISIVIAIIVIGFLTPNILKEIQKRHYPDIELNQHSNIFILIIQVLKWLFVMMMLFFFLIPFYFIPFLNIIALNIPLYYFFHKMLTYDVTSNIMTKEEKVLITYHQGQSIRLKTLALYLVSLIPFAIYFGAVFYVIYLGHTYFNELRKLRSH